MGKETYLEKIKRYLGGLAWDVFIWSLPMTEEEYFKSIYRQEELNEDKTLSSLADSRDDESTISHKEAWD